ncbi:MAG: M48 family metalloprotease [Armatimonadota bacterium]
MHRWWKWLTIAGALVVMPLLMGSDGGCGGIGGGGSSSSARIDEPMEIRIGQQAAVDVEQRYGVVSNTERATRVAQIGRAVSNATTRSNLLWSFKVLDLGEVNAFSLPGGPVYVTRGLLLTGLSDAELAGVLAHEVAHVLQRHAVKALERGVNEKTLSDLTNAQSDLALRTVADQATQYAMQHPRSEADEFEADALGIRLAYNAGYAANGLLAFQKRLNNGTTVWVKNHTVTAGRLTRTERLVADTAAQTRPVPVALSSTDREVLANLSGAPGAGTTVAGAQSDWPSWDDTERKIVPIVSLGTPGLRLGLAQVTGPRDRVDDVKAVLQIDAEFQKAARIKVFVPSNSLTSLHRVQGTAVTMLIQYTAFKF